MATLRTILAATDLTTQSERAIESAFALAAERRAKVTICHVLAAPRAPNPVYAQLYPKSLFQREAWMAAATKARAAIESRWPPGANRNYQIVITRGDPADEIVRQAEEQHSDVIVLAAGRRRRLLGSVVEKVVRRARCSVLIVR